MAVLAAAAAVIYFTGTLIHSASPAGAMLRSRPVVIIDPGHGGEDGGASGTDGTLEKELNLEVSLKLRDMLKAMGYRVIMTRETDAAIHDGETTIRGRKRSDLGNRAEIIEKNPDALYVSIHMNTFSQARLSGTQVFYSGNNPASKVLAESIQGSIKKNIQPENNRGIKKASDDIYLLKTAKSTAVLVECGFLTNPGELELLKSDEYQCKLAFAIVNGLMGN